MQTKTYSAVTYCTSFSELPQQAKIISASGMRLSGETITRIVLDIQGTQQVFIVSPAKSLRA